MRDVDGSTDGLALQAFLYASGELEPTEAAAFEHRLADNQGAREALAHAVQLTQVPAGLTPPRPDPAYREAVCRRLRPGRWDWFLRRRSYRGHPVVWTGLGAAAAVLLTLGLWAPKPAAGPMPDTPVAVVPTTPAEPPAPEPADPAKEVATVWADLSNHDHVARAREEEMRRRTRVEDRSRVVRGEDRHNRILGKPSRP
jgi:hypothetical protein